METFVQALIIFAVIAVYMLPVYLAAKRKHKYRKAIFYISMFLGWTVIGWVVALAWSLTNNPEKITEDTKPVIKTDTQGVVLLILAIVLLFTIFVGWDWLPNTSMSSINKKLAQDAEAQYKIVKSTGGSKMDLCVQAGMVKTAYLQAQDSLGYEVWSLQERADCFSAGIRK